jgi:hypothetical protein
MLVIAALNLGFLTLLFFVVGMIKPQWALFFMDKPNRFIILMATTILVMVSFTMYGEGMRRKATPKEWVKVPAFTPEKPVINPKAATPVPVPEVKSDTPAASEPTSDKAPAVAPVTSSSPSFVPGIAKPSATPDKK